MVKKGSVNFGIFAEKCQIRNMWIPKLVSTIESKII